MAHYYCSDLHLRGLDDGGRTESLIAFTERRCADATQLTLLGDLFDFALAHPLTLYRPFYPIYRALERLAARGVSVRVFTGNHDPDPDPFLESLGVTVHRHGIQETLYGCQQYIAHGDLLEVSWRRRLICQLARSQPLLSVARRIPPALAWRLALAYGGHALSDEKGEEETEAPWVMEEAQRDHLWAELDRQEVERLIVGHFHCALHLNSQTLPGPSASTLIVLGDWLQRRSYLRVDEAGPVLYRFRGGDRDPLDPLLAQQRFSAPSPARG